MSRLLEAWQQTSDAIAALRRAAMSGLSLQRMRILIVDDNELNVLVLEKMLATSGYSNVASTTDPSQVVELCRRQSPDLILLDLHMPDVSGFQVMAALARSRISGRRRRFWSSPQTAAPRRAGARSPTERSTSSRKPFDRSELELRVRNHLHTRRLALELEAVADDHEERARRAEHELDSARLEVLERLAHAAEFRDDESTLHTWRVGRLSGMLAEQASVAPDVCEQLTFAARLHDVGKIAVPDELIFKRGPLSASEWEVVRRHTTVGAQILSGSDSPLMKLAETIARSHHERWDGAGYPRGLREERDSACREDRGDRRRLRRAHARARLWGRLDT